jgi:CHAD domain-containing protein
MLAQGRKQMTANRTAIRRWLEVRGGTHRPPRGAWKARHRYIVAPLAATLAAGAAVGVGVVLARAENDRRGRRRRRSERRLRLHAEEQLGRGLKRMALAQADLALEELAGVSGESSRKAVHETRKAIKRMRTIVRLLEGELGAAACAREQARLRAAAAGLAGARDAEVLLETLDGLISRNPKRLAKRKGVRRLRERLEADRTHAEARIGDPDNRLRVASQLRAFRTSATSWPADRRPGIGSAEAGLRRIYRQGRRRMRRAARGRKPRMHPMHQWRKRVKDLRYGAEALERARPRGSIGRPGRSKRARAPKEARWLRGLATGADELGEVLGEEHDLAVLGAWLRSTGREAGARRGTLRLLEKAIAKRRAKLRRRALRKGRRLYRRSPKRFVRRLASAYARCAPPLS